MLVISNDKCFGGQAIKCVYVSAALGNTWTTLGVFVPPGASPETPVPVIWYLPGIMVSYNEGLTKGGFLEHAAKSGIGMIFPDSSPRGAGVPGEGADFRVGLGAGYFMDATAEPWSTHHKGFTFLVEELPSVLATAGYPFDFTRQSVIGHSGGGHASMSLNLLRPQQFVSASAIAPMCNFVDSFIGKYVCPLYFKGGIEEARAYNVPDLVRKKGRAKMNILVSIGTADFGLGRGLAPGGMLPEDLELAVKEAPVDGDNFLLEWPEGYDHSYFFNETVAAKHIAFHGEALLNKPRGSAVPLPYQEPEALPRSLAQVRRLKPDEDVGAYIDELLAKHLVVVFMRRGVGECPRAEAYLKTRPFADQDIAIIYIDGLPEEEAVKEHFARERGFEFWPACFFKGRFYGGVPNLIHMTSIPPF